DDIALTGVRFREFAYHHSGSDTVFATLLSAPALRCAIEASEPRVIACVSGADLVDRATECFGDGAAGWRAQWMARTGNQAYWIGQTDPVCFAWSEPNVSFWNPVTEREEAGWRTAPNGPSLRNQVFADDNPQIHTPVQIQPVGRGRIRPSTQVLFGETGEGTVIGHIESGECFVLSDTAQAMWRLLIEHGDDKKIVEALRVEYGAGQAQIRHDLDGFLRELEGRGLIQRQG
ncbi:MAG: hypothetical protein ACI8PT_000275, partial [Gammaproteobacteria bacterium]